MPANPRINCCIKRCTRGTTKFAPGTMVICGKCWRRAPKDMRRQVTLWQQRYRRFEKRGDIERAEIAGRWADRAWNNVRRLLNDDAPASPGMDPLLAEDLRKVGLI